MNVHELIEAIRERPGMYLERQSLEYLGAFLGGWIFARYDTQDQEFLTQFQTWVESKFQTKRHVSCFRTIAFYSWGCDEEFEYFFKVYDEFMKEYPRTEPD